MLFGGCTTLAIARLSSLRRCGQGSIILLMYFTYVLLSEKDKKLYIGYTEYLKRRFILHNKGKVKATKNRRPFSLIYYEGCLDKKRL